MGTKIGQNLVYLLLFPDYGMVHRQNIEYLYCHFWFVITTAANNMTIMGLFRMTMKPFRILDFLRDKISS